jgi:hypothetical protein
VVSVVVRAQRVKKGPLAARPLQGGDAAEQQEEHALPGAPLACPIRGSGRAS